MSAHETIVEASGFLGINQRDREQDLISPIIDQKEIGRLELREAKNFDLTNRLSLVSRAGYSKILDIPGAHSGFPFEDKIVCMCSEGLILIDPLAKTYSVINANVSTDFPVSYARYGNQLYWANGSENGKIENGINSSWGLTRPGSPTVEATSDGGFTAGNYQVVLTFIDGYMETGAGKGVPVSLSSGNGIRLTNIPQPENGTAKIRVYITPVNGEVFLKYSEFLAGTTEAFLTTGALGKRLNTQFFDKPPVGHIVRKFRDRLLIAKGKFIFYSAPQRPNLFRPSVDVLPPFNGRIKMIVPVQDGFFVDDGSLSFVSFSKSDDTAIIRLLPEEHSVIEGSDVLVPGYWFGLQGTKEPVGFWWTSKGFPVIGGPGGQVTPVGDKEIAIPQYKVGASLLKEKNGLRQIISAFVGGGSGTSFGVSDVLTATLVTRGI